MGQQFACDADGGGFLWGKIIYVTTERIKKMLLFVA